MINHYLCCTEPEPDPLGGGYQRYRDEEDATVGGGGGPNSFSMTDRSGGGGANFAAAAANHNGLAAGNDGGRHPSTLLNDHSIEWKHVRAYVKKNKIKNPLGIIIEIYIYFEPLPFWAGL
jgi:hypothetical protein